MLLDFVRWINSKLCQWIDLIKDNLDLTISFFYMFYLIIIIGDLKI